MWRMVEPVHGRKALVTEMTQPLPREVLMTLSSCQRTMGYGPHSHLSEIIQSEKMLRNVVEEKAPFK